MIAPRWSRGLGVVGVAALLAAPAAAATLEVPGDHPTVADALAVAVPCDVVLVAEGDWDAGVVVEAGVTLRAAGEGAILRGAGADAAVELDNGGRLEGFTVTDADVGVRVVGSGNVVQDTIVGAVDVGFEVLLAQVWLRGVRVEPGVQTGVSITLGHAWLHDVDIEGATVGVSVYEGRFALLGGVVRGCGTGLLARRSEGSVTSVGLQDNDVGFSLRGPGEGVVVQDCAVVDNALGGQVVDGEPRILDNTFEGNTVGLATTFAGAEVLANRFVDSGLAAVSEGIGSASLIANNRLVGGGIGLEVLLADSHAHNNTVEAADAGSVVVGGGPTLVGNVFADGDTGLDLQGGDAIHGYNLYWANVVDLDGAAGDGTNSFGDPLLDPDGLPGAGSAVIDASSPLPYYEDVIGGRGDAGWTGGPRADEGYAFLGESPPWAEEPAPVDTPEGESVHLIGVFGDPKDDPLLVRSDVDPDDGLQYCDSFNGSVDFTPPDDGPWTVAFRAEDSEGFVVFSEVVVQASNQPPELVATVEDDAAEGSEVLLFTEVSDPSTLDTFTVDVDFDGDGAWDAEGLEPGFAGWTPPQSGDWSLVVRVTDDDGGEATAAVPVDVANLPPFLLTPLPPEELTVGDSIDLELTVDDPSPLDVVTASLVDPPEGMSLQGLRLRWTPRPDQLGAHPYIVQLVDSDGGEATYPLFVAVFDPDAAGGCGCGVAGSGGPGLLLLLVAAAARRRRP